MDYKTLAQQTAQEILGYNQITSGWKVVKTLVKKQIGVKSLLFFVSKIKMIQKDVH